jgi:hypothetical protein
MLSVRIPRDIDHRLRMNLCLVNVDPMKKLSSGIP